MGDITESILEGERCEHCGKWVTENAPGHPQLCAACESEAEFDDEEEEWNE